jgi:glycosyltransferase involved in cell wall biosynthesis
LPIQSAKISIIIPTFNQGYFIEETILSIINQNYKNFEIIIIDGGSSDGTKDIIKKYESAISFWISEHDTGQSNAINKGLEKVSGEIVTWLNSDDYYEPGALQTIVNLFEQYPEADIIHGKARLFGDKIKDKVIGLDHDIPLNEYLPYMRFPQPSSFYKNDFLSSRFTVNEKLHFAMDFELLARAILKDAKIKRTDALLSHYRLHAASKTNDEIKFLDEWALVFYKILRSLKNGISMAEKLEELKLVKKEPLQSDNIRFEVDPAVIFSNEELERAFLEHLHLHYHTNYRLFNHEQCRLISHYLKENYFDFYYKRRYAMYNFRLKFIPRFVFNMLKSSGR